MNPPGARRILLRLWPNRKLLVIVGVAVPCLSHAASRPVLLDQTYTEPALPAPVLANEAPPCKIHVVELTDARRSPEMVGMLGGKPVFAPTDRAAWLQSIVNGLNARGFAVDFGGPAAAQPQTINAQLILQTAWITAVQVNLNESVVFKMRVTAPGDKTIDQYYRGSVSRMDWVAGDGEIKTGINLAFARALNAIAHDLAPLCDQH